MYKVSRVFLGQSLLPTFIISEILVLVLLYIFLVFVKTFNFSLCSCNFSWVLWTSLRSLPSTVHWVNCLSPFFSFSSEVLPCSFIWNIFLCQLILPNLLFLFLCIWQAGYISWPWRSDLWSEIPCVSEQCTVPWLPELYALGLPPM